MPRAVHTGGCATTRENASRVSAPTIAQTQSYPPVIDGEAVCHDEQCISPYVEAGWFEGSEDDTATVFAGFVYLRRLEPLSYLATVGSFRAIARATTTTAIDIGIPEGYQSTPASPIQRWTQASTIGLAFESATMSNCNCQTPRC